MKKFSKMILCAFMVFCLLSGIFMTVCSADEPGPVVDFTTEGGFEKWDELRKQWDLRSLFKDEYTVHGTNGKVQWQFMTENGESFTRFTPIEPLDENGKDASGKRDSNEGDFRMTAEIEFPAADYDFIAFCYRTSPKAHIAPNQIYVRDDKHSGEFEGTTGMWTPHSLKTNGEWSVKVLKISSSFTAVSKSATFKSIRIPIAGRVNEYLDIKWIAAFKTKDDAQNFDIAAYVAANATPVPTEAPTPEPTAVPSESNEPAATPDSVHSETGNNNSGIITGVVIAVIVVAGIIAAVIIRKRKK